MLKLQILVLAVICSKGFSKPERIMCSTNKSATFLGKTTYYMDYFCCRNFEKKNGKCIECQHGFTTSNGKPCQPCGENKFGKKCAHTCHCMEGERCNRRQGCVPLYSVSTETHESHHTSTSDDMYENKTYSEGNDEHGSNYINYVIWTGCILFIILIVVGSSICYVLNNNLLLKHSANVNSILQERITKRAVLSSSDIVPGPCDTINEQALCLDHEMEIQVVTTEAFNKNSN